MSVLPKISVVMPSLNQGPFLDEAIRSVLDQEANVELIIIDGGSTDQSVGIIKKYENRIAFWVSEKDRGQSHALNKGLSRAKGEIVTWLNSDDLYEPGALKTAGEFFSLNPDVDLLHGRSLLFGKGKKQTVGPASTLEKWAYLPYMRFPQPSSFFRRSFIEKLLPLNEGLHYAMDQELVAKAILGGANIHGIKNTLSRYRLHDASKSMNDEPFLEEWSEVFANVLGSLTEGKEFSGHFARLGLAKKKPRQSYKVSRSFSHAEVQKAYLEHLHLRLHGFYRNSDKQRMKETLAEIKEIDPGFARKNRYSGYMLKLTLVPGFIHKLYRTLRK